ncbi:MAG: hypothetical protein NTY19_20015 [Planctomycetota bacterium]|nr:hypothetical protein [Planctomycetota bacterium]
MPHTVAQNSPVPAWFARVRIASDPANPPASKLAVNRESNVSPVSPQETSRRDFDKWSGEVAVGTALASLSLRRVNAA